MNIHLPAILGFTRYQGFDPSPYVSRILGGEKHGNVILPFQDPRQSVNIEAVAGTPGVGGALGSRQMGAKRSKDYWMPTQWPNGIQCFYSALY